MIDPLPGDIFTQGQVLNNTYEIQGLLGRGGTGEVYLARNQISGRRVAIKALSSQFSGNEDYVELMKREEEMRDIHHDAVVRYTECSRTEHGHVILVMDFIDGMSMSDVMLDRRMDPRELMIIAHRVAEGLVVAHRHGIVHRDLSPDNIILRDGEPERATIIDFGIAKDTAAGARTIVGNDFAGKYEYAAPEQLDGRAEPRSDLYALGALLLAGFRGSVPFAGATPGEMVRRKQNPLDTSGVPEPLKGLIDWLADPDLAKRPANAEAVTERIDQLLKPQTHRGARPVTLTGEKPKRRGAFAWVLVLVLLVGGGGAAAYFSGLIDPYLAGLRPPALQVASPYRLAARYELGEVPVLSGHAPDPERAALLRDAFGAVTGAAPGEDALEIAQGMPNEGWAAGLADLFGRLAGLSEWTIGVSDTSATVMGVASDRPTRAAAEGDLRAWASDAGFTLAMQLATGPVELPAAEVAAMLEDEASCGPLRQGATSDASYPLGSVVTVTGALATQEAVQRLQSNLADRIGDRTVRIDAQILNDDLCKIRRVLPQVPENSVSVWLGDGATNQPNLAGIFHVDDNPVVEVHLPETVRDGSLWVVIVDNTGKVFHILPNINRNGHQVAELGYVQGGIRQIRTLYSIEEFVADNRLMAMRISPESFGKSEVIAILSREPLFDLRRPRDESIESFAEALAEEVAARPGNILGIASRIIDARP